MRDTRGGCLLTRRLRPQSRINPDNLLSDPLKKTGVALGLGLLERSGRHVIHAFLFLDSEQFAENLVVIRSVRSERALVIYLRNRGSRLSFYRGSGKENWVRFIVDVDGVSEIPSTDRSLLAVYWSLSYLRAGSIHRADIGYWTRTASGSRPRHLPPTGSLCHPKSKKHQAVDPDNHKRHFSKLRKRGRRSAKPKCRDTR